MRGFPNRLLLKALALALAVVCAPHAQDWGGLATISSTMGINTGRICVGEASRGDIGCPTYAPTILANGTISATALTINGVSVGGAGASTFASLTDVSYSAVNGSIGGPTSKMSGRFQSTAFGYEAINTPNTGGYNTAFGYQALQAVTTGTSNVGIGPGALQYASTGSGNVGIGYRALLNVYTGQSNLAIGDSALRFAIGNYNIALGMGAGTGLTSAGNFNTFVGAGTGPQDMDNGDSIIGNTILGYAAGTSLFTGATSNTILGTQAGYYLTTGDNNILIGYGASPSSVTGNNQLSIGNAIYGDLGRNPLSDYIGINVISPSANLEVSGTVSASAVFATTAFTTNGYLTVGNSSMYIGLSGSIPYIRSGGAGTKDLMLSGGSNMPEAVRIVSSGYVGIRASVPTVALDVSGAIVSRAFYAAPGLPTTIDFSQANVAYTDAACGSFTLTNMRDGGAYTLVVKGNGTGPASFTHSGLTPKTTATLTCTASKHTVFSILRAGTDFYVSMVTGF